MQGDAIAASYLWGVNPVCAERADSTNYFLYNAHGDVIQLANENGVVTKSYAYDAFGNEKNPVSTDVNPFRYCGEYWDGETKTYYLRARYYDPAIGRFTQMDTHWNVSNMIYGDNPQKINERQDALGLKTYTYVPQITAILQAGNLYVYGVNNPIKYVDANGNLVSDVFGISLLFAFINGIATSILYASNGQDYRLGFLNGFIPTLVSAIGLEVGAKKLLPNVGALVGNAIGTAIASGLETMFFSDNPSVDNAIKNAAKDAAMAIVTTLPAAYMGYAVDFANKSIELSGVLMNYDLRFGEVIRRFFEELSYFLSLGVKQ